MSTLPLTLLRGAPGIVTFPPVLIGGVHVLFHTGKAVIDDPINVYLCEKFFR